VIDAESLLKHPDLYLPLPKTTRVELTREQYPVDVLLVTSNSAEFYAVLRHMKPLPGQTTVLKGQIVDRDCYAGVFGVYRAVLIAFFSHDVSGVAVVVEGIGYWKPKATFIIGFAFGLDPNKQRVGDVLVSQLFVKPASSSYLPDQFKKDTDWNYANAQVHHDHGPLVPTFESDGFDFATACQKAEIQHWVAVQGVCGFNVQGELNSDVAKKVAAAATAVAASLVNHVLSTDCLSEIGCQPILSESKSFNNEFDIYL